MSISLKPHNIETYQKVTEKMKESNKVAVIHPTGTGKMFIALKFLEENKGKKAIYLAPTNAILHDVKKNIFAEGMTMVDFPLLKRMTYQKLTKFSDEEIDKLDADIIILDEFHHCGAPEWGKGVERLIQKNEGAQILGLSATPLRYFDGLRDMADELFENNVASEMTLEEAIESGILPEATYVSALYGYNKELENMQEQINKIKNVDKLQQAQSLLNGLREKLDANTDNLSDLFSTYMQNSNGKYIIFCRNIEDMDEKIKQSREMFEKVNPNITVRAVSSKIKEADSVFTEFEQDADESTLKLLYAVNMINEGYHIKDLDGVIMMRPTFSPTIYTQQLGRALTVGEDKKPVVLDLVNNFDSCKIIEDFAEKMKQYKGNEGTGKIEENKKSRISILDKTKEFREIAEKITELSSTKDVSLEEKIQIFEKFAQTGEELVGNTIFEGYPIGQWAIQIRNVLNRINNGKEEKQKINLTKKQIEKLKNLGILERQIESTIDEKIDSLVEWRRKYPKATITPMVSNEILSVYAKTEEEQKKLMEEYRKIIKYYGYVRFRKSQGKLNEEQIEKCREGNVGGVFGKSTETINKIEDETNMLMQKYGLNEETISLIKKQYGSIDEFRKIYIGALINQDIENSIPKKILENANLINAFDLSSPDWVLRSSGAVELVLDMLEEKIIFMKYKGIEKDIIDTIRTDNFTEPEQQVLTMIYGLNGEKRVNQSQAAINIGKSKERARQIHWHAIRKLNSSKLKIYLKNRISNIDYDLQKQIIEEYFNNFDIFVPRETTSMDEEVKNKLNNMLIDGIEKTKKRNEQVDIIKRMSEEQKMDILKARFGETISSSDISVVPPSSYKYIFWGRKNDIIDIDEYIKKGWFVDILYKECLDSKYCQAKIAEFMVNSFTNSELIEAGKINEIEEIITNNVYFNESKKNQLKRLLGKRIIEAIEENILKKTESDTSSMQSENAVERLTIEELDLSIRSFNCLNRAGIITVQDLMENTDEEIRNIRNFGKKSYDEVIDKLQSIGIEIIDGNFKFAGAELSESNKEQTDNTNENIIIRIEHEINNSNIFSEEEKEMLRKQLMERCYMEEESFRAEIVGDGKNSLEIIEKWPIEELDLSIRSYNCLARAGIKTVEDLMKKTDEEIRNIRNFGKKSYDEIIEKMQSVGIEIVDGHFIDAKSHNRSHIKRMSELEERINNNKYIREEKREELKKLLYETFDLTRADNQEIQSKLGDVESKEDLEEISKEELVKHILEQQRTIAKQREEIDELSSQKKEEINE